MPLLDKIQKVSQDVVKGAKDITGSAREKLLLSDEEKEMNNLYMQIGKLYYETQDAVPGSQLGDLCLAVKQLNERLIQKTTVVAPLKGTKRCPSCGTDIAASSTFCGLCGARFQADMPQPDMVQPASMPSGAQCPSCGADIDPSATFCGFCGNQISGAIPQAPQPTVCGSCGNPTEPGAKFCPSCGSAQ